MIDCSVFTASLLMYIKPVDFINFLRPMNVNRPCVYIYKPSTRFIKTFKVYVLQKIITFYQKFSGCPNLGSLYRDKKKTVLWPLAQMIRRTR